VRVIAASGPELKLAESPLSALSLSPATGAPMVPNPGTLAEATRSAIEGALAAAGGRIYGTGGAAERLALKPSTLQSKMRKLRIDRRRFVSGEP
jgi:transcriptional regulator with GAF, ATPase, and Fis domain